MMDTKSLLKLYVCVAFLSCVNLGSALTMKNASMSLEQLTHESDDIVIGNVTTEEPRVIGRSFETAYKVEVSENLKSATGSLKPGKTFIMTLPGASLTTPPITQYVSGVPYMGKGEKVLLFLKNSKNAQPSESAARASARLSTLPSSPKVIGWNQGRFSVFTNPETGKPVVARVNLENYGLLNSGADVNRLLEAAKTQQIKLIEQKIVRSADIAGDSRTKDPLEVTPADAKNLKVETAAQQGDVVKNMRQRGGLAVQDLDAFKREVQQYVNDAQ